MNGSNPINLPIAFDADSYWTADISRRVDAIINAQLGFALGKNGAGVLPGIGNTYTVTAGTGRTVNIATGAAIVGTAPFGCGVYNDAIVNYGGNGELPVNRDSTNPIYLFADYSPEFTGTDGTIVRDSFETRAPYFRVTNSPTLSGAVLLATITTNATTVTSVVPNPDRFIATGADGSGQLSKSVAGGADVTLTASEAQNGNLEFTGALTANINVIVPTTRRVWRVYNRTSGAFTLTIKTPGTGTGVAVAQGAQMTLESDGTNVVMAPTTPESTQAANTFRRGPTSGAAALPTWGAIVAADLPTADTTSKGAVILSADRGTTAGRPVQASDGRLLPFVGSGSTHATGLVPDPGATAGTTRFLREDGTFAVPATPTTLFLPNQTSAPSAPTAGVILFAQGGVLKCIVPSGAVTTLAS